MRNTTHVEVFFDAAGTVRVDRDFGHVAIVVGIGNGFFAKKVLAECAKTRVLSGKGCIWLVLFARQVRVPGRQAGATSDPQTLDGGGIHVVVLHQAKLAGGLVLIQGQHGNGGRKRAIGLCIVLVPSGVFKLHHSENGFALDAAYFRMG
jgi:hypothetical protein